MQRVLALDDLLGLLANSSESLEVQSAPNAAASHGALYMKSMIDQAQREYSNTKLTLWVDCGAHAGVAMSAIRTGLLHLVVDVPDAVFTKLEDIAAQSGAQLRRR